MNATDCLPNGMMARDSVRGWDLNNGRGFKNYREAKDTLDPDNIEYGSLWKIDGEVFKLKKMFNRPVFGFIEEE